MKRLTTILLVSSLTVGSLAATTLISASGGYGYRDCPRGEHKMGRGFKHGGDGGFFNERRFENLELSDEQRTQIRALVDESRPQMREFGDKMRDNRKELRTLVQGGSPDEAEVRKLADTQGDLKAEMIVLRTKVYSDIRTVLTEEQREQINQTRPGERR